MKRPEQCQGRRSGFFITNFEQLLHIALVFPLLKLKKQVPVGYIFNTERNSNLLDFYFLA